MLEGLEQLLKKDDTTPPVPPVQEPAEPKAEPTEVIQSDPTPATDAPVAPQVGPVINNETETLKARIAELEKALSLQPKLDPFIENLVSTYLSGGDLSPYLSAKTTDFDKMSDEEVYKINLRKQYDTLDEATFDLVYASRLKQFLPDPDSATETELATGKALLKAETAKIRGELKKEQEKFLAPISPEKQREELQKIEQAIYQDAATVSLVSTQKLQVKVGDSTVFVGVPDPKPMVASTLDPQENFFNYFMDQATQKPDLAKWYEVVAYAQNPELFKKLIYDAGVASGKKDVTSTLINPDDPIKPAQPNQQPATLLDALASALGKNG